MSIRNGRAIMPRQTLSEVTSQDLTPIALFDHAAADARFGASVFWVRRLATLGGEQPMVEYWQAKRGGGQRGIIEIVEETND